MATNVKVITGSKIPKASGTCTSWSFEMLDFRDLEVYSLNQLPYKKDLEIMMKGKSAMIVVLPMGETASIDANIVATDGKREELKKYPCCIKSQSGALMPQIIVPTESGFIVDNGLVSGSDEREIGKVFLKGNGGYKWIPSGLTNARALDYGSRREEQKFAGYIDNSNSRCNVDNNGIATRKYKLEGTGNYSNLKGSCAFMYRFSATSGPQEGKTNVVPKIYVEANGQNNKRLACSIATDMDVFARYADDTAQGRISNPSAGFYPPQHYDIGGSCVFMYPLYSGFCFSGSATKQLSSESDDIDGAFIAYSELNSPFDALTIENSSKTKEIIESIKENPETEMTWFPTLVSESSDARYLRLKVDNKNKKYDIRYNDFNIEWIKSLGAFAYSPIFFCKCVEFYLYFKGAHSTPVENENSSAEVSTSTAEASTTYTIYPIAASADVDDAWRSSGGSGTNLNIVTNGCPAKSATCVAFGDDNTESIYKVKFSFDAEDGSKTRIPMEVFGCCIAAKTTESLGVLNDNGVFTLDSVLNNKLSSANVSGNNYIDYITNVSISSSLQGTSGSMDLDMDATSLPINSLTSIEQSIGELDLACTGGKYSATGNVNVFTGYGMEIKQNVTESSHSLGIRLEGVQKKLSDMKLVACPFWDGDRLEMICGYFQSYTGIQLKMVNHSCKNILDATMASNFTGNSNSQSWKSEISTVVGNVTIESSDFRVPRSIDYRKPAVDFPTGTSCLDALNKLAEMTSCVFIVQPDGCGYFFELNKKGYPYYVDNQVGQIVSFQAEEVISLNISPYLDNKFNFFVTSGFIMKKDRKTKKVTNQTVTPKFIFSSVIPSGSNFPWSRMAVNVENGYLTVSELAYFHSNNVKFGLSDMYQGTLTVPGNEKVTHIYQKINVCGTNFFVISIDHNINIQTKEWTTSYGLNKIDDFEGDF